MMIERRNDERGSAIVTVLVLMLVLSLLAGTLAVVVANTTSVVVQTRSSMQSRAAADAGIAAGVAKLRTSTADPCGLADLPGTDPNFKVEFDCRTAGEVRMISTGNGPGGATSRVQATYAYTSAVVDDIGSDSHMTFFGSATFTYETRALSEGLLNIALPNGDFTCQATVMANIIVAGKFKGNGTCDVKGSVIAGDTISTSNATDRIRGDAIAAGTGLSSFPGTVGRDFVAGGPVEIAHGTTGIKVTRNLQAGGSIRLLTASVGGNVTLPVGSTLCTGNSCSTVVTGGTSPQVGGDVVHTDVDAPAAPEFESWFDYSVPATGTAAYDTWAAAEWPGYTTWVPTAAECEGLNSGDALLWNQLSTRIESATILDARTCINYSNGTGFLTSNNGGTKSVTLKANVVFLAAGFHISGITINAAAGQSPKVWFIVPDNIADEQPSSSATCWSGNYININHATINVSAMAYTPGCINVSGGGTWRGAIYGGAFNYGGALDFWGESISLPGMPSAVVSTGTGSRVYSLGGLVDQRDIP